jgi:hypothetical protein
MDTQQLISNLLAGNMPGVLAALDTDALKTMDVGGIGTLTFAVVGSTGLSASSDGRLSVHVHPTPQEALRCHEGALTELRQIIAEVQAEAQSAMPGGSSYGQYI